MFIMKQYYINLKSSLRSGNNTFKVKKNSLKLLLSAVLIFVALAGNATIYYVSTSGNDSNSGTSSDKPWQTLAKVNSFSFKPGDQILFRSGEEWAGSITVNVSGTAGSPIVYGSYGTGTKPKIMGSEVITGWTKHSGNIYKASFNKDITQLFLNNQRVRVARYPNNGYFFVNSVQNSTQFTSNELDGGINYAGATWFGRSMYWLTELKKVTSSSSKTITLESTPSYNVDANEGFFLMNKLDFLDQAGEWYYDSSANTVYLWTPNGDSPENYVIRGSVHDIGVYASRKDYITIQGLEITQQRKDGIHSPNSNYLTVKNNTISFQEENGIHNSSSSNHNIISNNVIRGMNGNGIYFWATNDILIEDNEIYDVALWENIGIAGTFKNNAGSGMEISGDRNVIRYNRIIGMGYNGIFWRGATLIEYNFIQKICLIKDDGGGIYTNTSGSHATVRHNIVLDAVGAVYGFTVGRGLAEGIYIDETAVGVKVEHNTVAHSSNSGIKLHRNDNATVRYNTIMDARQSIHILKSSGNTQSNISNNIMYASKATDDYLPRQVLINNSSGNSICDYNTFINPHTGSGIFRDQDYYSFDEWKTKSGQDKNSRFIGTKLASGEKEQLFYNDTKSDKIINLGSKVYKDLDGKQVTGSITLKTFTSRILIATNSESSVEENMSPVIDDQYFEFLAPKKVSELIGQVVASDPDAGQELTYTIVGGNEENLFQVGSTTGNIYTNMEIPATLNKTVNLLVQVRDNGSSPLSAEATVSINIKSNETEQAADVTAPAISSFSIPSTSNSLVVPVTVSASDNIAVTGWNLSETSAASLAGDGGWSSTAPVEYTFSSEGSKTLYVWVKDAAGNVSASVSKSVTISLQVESIPSADSVEYITICEGQDYMGWTESGTYERVLTGETAVQAAGTNQILNPAFSDGTTGWSKWNATGYNINLISNSNDYNSAPSSLQIDCTANGTSVSSIQLISKGNIALEAGKVYSLTFYAKASTEFTIGNIYIHKGSSPWTNYGSFDLSKPAIKTSWNQYQIKFTANQSATDGSFRIYLGNSLPAGHKVYFDDFSFAEYSEETVSTDKVVVTYLTVNSSSSSTEEVTIAEGEDYLGWTQSGEYTRTIESVSGCDSTITTNLIVTAAPEESVAEPVTAPVEESVTIPVEESVTIPVEESNTEPVEPEIRYETEYVTICEGDEYNGWTEAGVYESLISSDTGTQIFMTTHLTIEATTYATETIKIWKGENYNGWTEPGHYERVLEAAAGCDSVVVTKLLVRGKGQNQDEVTAAIYKPIARTEDGPSDFRLESAGENEFLLYPNPARTFINVEYRSQPGMDTMIEIVDGSGRTVHKQEARSISSRIDFNQLSPGMYYLRSVNKQSQRVEKFIIK